MKLKTKQTIYVGIAFLIICMFWQVYDAVVAKMLINSFGLNQFWSGVVMALDNILALFMLPLFGALSDKTNTKWGKRIPYIFIGIIVAAVLFTGVALIDYYQHNLLIENSIPLVMQLENGAGYDFMGTVFAESTDAYAARSSYILEHVTMQNVFVLIAFIGILFLVLIAMAVFRTPAVSLMPDVTPKPLRSKANAIINLMGTAGGIISLGMMTVFAKDNEPYIWCFVILAVLMLIGLAIFMWKVNEVKLVKEMHEESKEYGIEEIEEVDEKGNVVEEKMPKDVRRSFILILSSVVLWFFAYNAATTKFSVYAEQVLFMGYTIPLLVAQATAVIAFIPIGILAGKLGRKRTILIGIGVLALAFVLGTIATPDSKALIYITMGLAGIGWATINVNSYPMIVEMSKGSNIGKYTGYYYTASMAAQIFTPMISGALMDVIDLKILFPYSVIFCIAAFITMSFVKHGDSKPIPVKTIEAFDTED